MLDIRRVIASAPGKPRQVELQPLVTPWGEEAASMGGHGPCDAHAQGGGDGPCDAHAQGGGHGPEHPCAQGGGDASDHPHPQFARERFLPLDGWWDYRIVAEEEADSAWRTAAAPAEWDGSILVPFSPEAPLSGVGRRLGPDELLWYRRALPCPDGLHGRDGTRAQEAPAKDRCILHFEAVDYACACYCNGVLVGTHVGGYLPFAFDITDALTPADNEVALCVYDPSDDGVQLRGKQKLERGGIWYTAQSGIWQTVWLEVVPESHIAALAIDARPDDGRLTLTVTVQEGAGTGSGTGVHEAPLAQRPLDARLLDGGSLVCTAHAETPEEAAAVAVPGAAPAGPGGRMCTHTLVLDVPDPHLWSPDDPHLYRLKLSYGQDLVASYCAFRTVTMEEDGSGAVRLCINHEPCFLRGVLDQGYWPDGLMTAPSDEALVFDIQTMKGLGFNMLRKHIKVESDRWYYHCDRLGMLVWQDMVCGGSRLSPWHSSRKPTLFRRSWGRYDDGPHHYRSLSAESAAYRDEWTEACRGTIGYLGNHPSIVAWVLFNEAWGQFDARKATGMVRRLDPTRPIDAVSGWYDQACGDFLSVHNYFRPLEVYRDPARPKRAFVISEFGGLSCHLPEHSSLATSYGYESYSAVGPFRDAVQETLATAGSLEQQGLAGFVYTQLSDVEEETNGLLTYDRRINKMEEGHGA